jgi:homeobox-leucine zipper protein
VASLTDKLQEEEVEAGASAAADAAEFTEDVKQASLAVDPEESAAAEVTFEAQQVKSEDRLSAGSAVVVDADAHLLGSGAGALAAVDNSVESYFPGGDDYYNDCGMGPVDQHCAAEFQSEEDDGAGSDEGCSYYADENAAAAAAFFAGQAHHHVDDDEDDGQISWWMWS